MREFSLASMVGLAALTLGLVSGCGSMPPGSSGNQKQSFDGALPPSDGATEPVDAAASGLDAGGCQCLLGSDHILRMTWACFCANYNEYCSVNEANVCGSDEGWSSGCGLDVFTTDTFQGPVEWVFDHQSGAVVGVQGVNQDGVFACPTNANLQSSVAAAGTFPDATCALSTTCGCTDAGPPCPLPDSGTNHL